jgi:hypothetical protein
MNADFNLHDEVFLGGKAGKIVGLLEGGIKVMIKFFDGTDHTISADHPHLLTAKQKAVRERVKIAQERISAQMTEGGRKTEVSIPPALRKAEPVPTEALAVPMPNIAPAEELVSNVAFVPEPEAPVAEPEAPVDPNPPTTLGPLITNAEPPLTTPGA